MFWQFSARHIQVYCEKAYNDGSDLPEETKLGTECNLFEIEDGAMTVSEYEENEKKRQAKEMEDFYNFINYLLHLHRVFITCGEKCRLYVVKLQKVYIT